jgi:hypothetical protein
MPNAQIYNFCSYICKVFFKPVYQNFLLMTAPKDEGPLAVKEENNINLK